jgi:hypothetical protein
MRGCRAVAMFGTVQPGTNDGKRARRGPTLRRIRQLSTDFACPLVLVWRHTPGNADEELEQDFHEHIHSKTISCTLAIEMEAKSC